MNKLTRKKYGDRDLFQVYCTEHICYFRLCDTNMTTGRLVCILYCEDRVSNGRSMEHQNNVLRLY